MSTRRAGALVAVLIVALLPSALAWADGDPASDVLLGENVFYPYLPPVSASLQKTLNAETKAAAKAHFPIKVALIASPTDLGVVPELFGKPQTYADFLDKELRFIGPHPPLLVVMPHGYGVQGLPAPSTAAAQSLPKPSGSASNDLAQSAVDAVQKLSAAAGHPVSATLASSDGGGGGGASVWELVLVIALAVLVAGTVIALRRRRAHAS